MRLFNGHFTGATVNVRSFLSYEMTARVIIMRFV